MYLLDTNALKLAISGEEGTTQKIAQHLGAIQISSVTAEEVLALYLNSINRARSHRTSLSLPRAHQDFVQALEDLGIFPILAFSNAAEEIYRTFSPALIRVGSQDCRIAAQAMAHGLTVVPRNVRDFQAIGVDCEDWSVS